MANYKRYFKAETLAEAVRIEVNAARQRAEAKVEELEASNNVGKIMGKKRIMQSCIKAKTP